jgi:hypothetical protein
MVSVVQLVEHQVVILGVAGSSPVTHPTGQRVFSPSGFFIWRAARAISVLLGISMWRRAGTRRLLRSVQSSQVIWCINSKPASTHSSNVTGESCADVHPRL